ncbi:hypothetical protein RRF57_010903 [Xylaria bambusicola]|uniref:Uncharacterized protein n=1 Tax=Xylaria bambusicola TaxID=326684 RepID=A0AAN7UXS3_9PEZI
MSPSKSQIKLNSRSAGPTVLKMAITLRARLRGNAELTKNDACFPRKRGHTSLQNQMDTLLTDITAKQRNPGGQFVFQDSLVVTQILL